MSIVVYTLPVQYVDPGGPNSIPIGLCTGTRANLVTVNMLPVVVMTSNLGSDIIQQKVGEAHYQEMKVTVTEAGMQRGELNFSSVLYPRNSWIELSVIGGMTHCQCVMPPVLLMR
jgi:hypothetical protein